MFNQTWVLLRGKRQRFLLLVGMGLFFYMGNDIAWVQASDEGAQEASHLSEMVTAKVETSQDSACATTHGNEVVTAEEATLIPSCTACRLTLEDDEEENRQHETLMVGETLTAKVSSGVPNCSICWLALKDAEAKG